MCVCVCRGGEGGGGGWQRRDKYNIKLNNILNFTDKNTTKFSAVRKKKKISNKDSEKIKLIITHARLYDKCE